MVGLPASASPGLGISVSIEESDQTDAELAGSIWIGGEQGETKIRTINIRSLSSDTDQQISFEVLDQIRVDGVPQTDFSQPSFLTEWITFEPESPVIAPGETVSVEMRLAIPLDAQDRAHEAVLRVLASGLSIPEGESENVGTQAIVGTRIAIPSEMWVGVGDALDLEPAFEITGVDGVLLDDQRFVRVFIDNTGLVPIRPVGTIQLSDPAFAERIFEPVDFRMSDVIAGEVGFVDVPVADDVVDGFYRTFVTAQSGTVRNTRLFEGQLVFDDPNALSIPDLLIRIGLFIFASLGLVFGYRMILKARRLEKEKALAEKEAAEKTAAQTKPAPTRKTRTKATSTNKATTSSKAPAKKPAAKSASAAQARQNSAAKPKPAASTASNRTAASKPPAKKAAASSAAAKSASTRKTPANKTQPTKTANKPAQRSASAKPTTPQKAKPAGSNASANKSTSQTGKKPAAGKPASERRTRTKPEQS